MAQGMKFLVAPIPWKSADGNTAGPLDSWILTLLLSAGFKPGYALLHILATGLICVQVLATFHAGRRVASINVASIASLTMSLFYGLASDPNFLAYSSELLPAALISCGAYCLVLWWQQQRAGSLLFTAGLAFGCTPWAKLQAGPIAALLGCALIAACVGRRTSLRRNLSLSISGLVLPSLAILVPVWHAGVLTESWNSYIRGSVAYAGATSSVTIFQHVISSVGSLPLLPLIVLLAAAAFGASYRACAGRDIWLGSFLVMYLGVAAFAMARPATDFPHYRTFIIHPLVCLTAFLLSKISTKPSAENTAQVPRVAYVSLLAVPLLCLNALQYSAYAVSALHGLRRSSPDANQRIASVLDELNRTHSSRSIAVWGGMAGVYVLTGRVPATRDAVTNFSITAGPMRAYFRNRFLNDLRVASPDVFVDTVVPGGFLWRPGLDHSTPYDWCDRDGYESDPALKDFIESNYVLARTLTLVPNAKPVRFFVKAPAAQSI